jgi:hypothetical protein
VTELLTRNAGWKIFSLLVSLILWFAYASEPEVGAFVSVPVEYRGMPEELEIGSDLVDSVAIDIRGPSYMVAGFSGGKSPLVLDFSAIHKPGERTFHIDERSANLPSGVRLVRAIPAQIRFEFERRTSVDVPVQVRFAGKLGNGYELQRYEVDPKTLTLIGPENHVNKIDYAVTDPIDLTSVVARAEFHVNAFVPDPHVRFDGVAAVTVRVIVEKKN